MPTVEMIFKDLNYLILSAINFFKNNFKNESILVYPHYPSRGSTIYKIAKQLNYNVTNKIKSGTKNAIYWEYLTHRKEYHFLEEISDKVNIINLHSRDISKKYIDKIHKKVFGYCTTINPLSYHGKMVKKSDINAEHDGVIIDAPIDAVEEQYIYQILIDNSLSDKLIVDIRVPVIGKVLDFVYVKEINRLERFENTTTQTTLKPVKEIFSDNEINLLNRYCDELNLEYGELDVLRNNEDGRIYAIDVNNTPHGPPANTSKTDELLAFGKLSFTLKTYITAMNK
tara:strand:+ start:582 stop:1433 length:852 start_codon:yes stop_codon:yes gene_type:complete